MNWRFWTRRSGRQRGADMPAPEDPNWERALINRMAAEFLREQRRSHRWSNIFKLAIVLYLVVLVVAYYAGDLGDSLGVAGEHTALIEVTGLIGPKTDASADRIITALRDAFEADNAKGIILRINSPGGSPVQSGYVYDEMRRLKEKYPDKPVYAVAVDACASGAYYIAAAADEIYVNPASLVGSIGVRMDSFGFQRAIDELGIQRRLLTAGEHKGIGDPFSPLSDFDKRFIQGLLDQLHAQFIAAVEEGRGERLKGGDELFSGLFWTGEESIELGLADGLGTSSSVAREKIGAEELVKYNKEQDLLDRLTDRLGASIARGLLEVSGIDRLPMLR
jgi:protease-4